jgi:hypothetical protein
VVAFVQKHTPHKHATLDQDSLLACHHPIGIEQRRSSRRPKAWCC